MQNKHICPPPMEPKPELFSNERTRFQNGVLLAFQGVALGEASLKEFSRTRKKGSQNTHNNNVAHTERRRDVH
jgi:hypothetical protein